MRFRLPTQRVHEISEIIKSISQFGSFCAVLERNGGCKLFSLRFCESGQKMKCLFSFLKTRFIVMGEGGMERDAQRERVIGRERENKMVLMSVRDWPC